MIKPTVKTLVIHPEDCTTTFLEPVYSTVHDKTVIKGGVTREKLKQLIFSHDRIMMMGHGSPYGLLSAGCFPDSGSYIIDQEAVPWLLEKSNNVYIWCYADHFVEANNLEGFYSGMFISEVFEADAIGFKNVSQSIVDQSNSVFSRAVSAYINDDSVVLYKNIMMEYGTITAENPVADFNHDRLYFSSDKHIQNINSL